jgi:predicted acylesterase/phospholipase RssA
MGGTVRILSIDGGGTFGLAPAMVLIELERRTQRSVAQLFDLVAGTSVGGLLGLALLVPGAHGAPRHSAAQIASLFEQDADRVYAYSLRHWLSTLGGFLGEKYEATGLQEVLNEVFGDTWLSEAIRPTLIPAYDLLQDHPYAFRSHHASTDPGADYPTSAVVRATTAVPGYFPPVELESRAGHPRRLCIDGGVAAFSPALWAYAEARRLYPDADEILLVSLGTARRCHDLDAASPRPWKPLERVRPMFELTCDAASAVTHEQLLSLLAAGGSREAECYVRLEAQVDLPGAGSSDDTNAEHLERVRAAGHALLAQEAARIDRLCAQLMPR